MIYQERCPNSASLELTAGVATDAVAGTAVGYELSYVPHTEAGTALPPVLLYVDEYFAFASESRDTPIPAEDRGLTFAPLPSFHDTTDIRIFTIPKGHYSHNAPFPLNLPPYMNIFLDPKYVSHDEFVAIGNCLAAEKKDLNTAFADIPNHYPGHWKMMYHPVSLGGLAFGLPPYQDPNYINLEKKFWGDEDDKITSIPIDGFTLYPGQSLEYKYSGHIAIISVDDKGHFDARVDGNKVRPMVFGEGLCTQHTLSTCTKIVWYGETNPDSSLSFDVSGKIGPDKFSFGPFPP